MSQECAWGHSSGPLLSAVSCPCPRIEVDDRTEAYLRVLQQKVTSDTQIVSVAVARQEGAAREPQRCPGVVRLTAGGGHSRVPRPDEEGQGPEAIACPNRGTQAWGERMGGQQARPRVSGEVRGQQHVWWPCLDLALERCPEEQFRLPGRTVWPGGCGQEARGRWSRMAGHTA